MKKNAFVITVLVCLFFFSVSVSAFEFENQVASPDAFTYWSRTYGDIDSNTLVDLWPTSDGGYIATAFVMDSSYQDKNTWVIKFDKDGAISWQNKFESQIYQDLGTIKQISGGSFIAAGAIDRGELSYYEDGWVAAFTANGTVDWQKWSGGLGVAAYFSAVR